MNEYHALKRHFPRASEVRPFLTLKRATGTRVQRRLAGAYTVEELRAVARRRTPIGPFHYVDGGADGEVSIRRAREAFEDIQFNPSILRDVHETDTTTTVLGASSALPFGFGPTGGTRLMHAAGESAVGRAAERAGIPYALSTVGTTSIAGLARAAPHGRHWFQLYPIKDRERSERMLSDAREHGYDALLLTVDVPVAGNNLRNRHTGMSFPPQLTPKTFLDASWRFEWWINLITTEPYRFTLQDAGAPDEPLTLKGWHDDSVTFDDLVWIREAWKGPLVIKGIQTLADAERAADAGADGIVLSNHGGRQLDRTPPPLHLLPDVAERFGSTMEVMLDSGVRSGADIVAAIALGARFVLLGRAYLYGLMAGGEAGVDRVVEILRSEVIRTMQLLGVRSVDELSREHVTLLSRYTQVATAESISGGT